MEMNPGEALIKKIHRYWIFLVMAVCYRRWRLKHFVQGAFTLVIMFSVFLSYHLIFTVELIPWKPKVDRWCDYDALPEYLIRPQSDEITVVTMFLDLGVFKKGDLMLSYHSPYKYRRWMRVFGKMANRVVAYMENDADIEYFREIRACFPASLTKIIKVHRNELDSFKNLKKIQRIYSLPSYPKHKPNTVYPEYTCAMSAKYDVLERSCIMDYFKTPNFAWVDIGLFRNLDGQEFEVFKLIPPDKYNPDMLSFSQAWPLDPALPPDVVMKGKYVWVSGAMILGTKEKMLNFTMDYKMAAQDLLDKGLSNSDQEVIHSMYTSAMRLPHYVKIKAYLCHQGQLGLYGADARYFCLGYVCKNAWEKLVPHYQKKTADQP